MPLYDSYQLANSTQVPTYQGSTVPELAQVSQQMQERYDAAQSEQDYVGRFMNSMQYLPKDQGQFQQWSQGYRNQLNSLSQHPDLENTLRETTMLAQNLPQQYAPFANRLAQYNAYQKQVMGKVDAGKISPEKGQQLLAVSLKQDPGMTKDPVTGQYRGSFNGLGIVDDVNKDELIDKILQDAAPSSEGYKIEHMGDKWNVINSEGKSMSPQRIAQDIQAGLANNEQYQAWLRQKQMLDTANIDYSKVDDNSMVDDSTITGKQRMSQGKNPQIIPVTLSQAIAEGAAKGMSRNEVISSIMKDQIARNETRDMVNYGVTKYTLNPSVSQTFSANPYGVADYREAIKNSIPAIAGSILQPSGGSNYSSPSSLAAGIAQTGQSVKDAQNAYFKWMSLNGIHAVGADGRTATAGNESTVNPFDPKTKWVDSSGNPVTGEALKWIGLRQQAIAANNQLQEKQQKAMKMAGFTVSDATRQKAEQAYRDELGSGEGRILTMPNGSTQYVKSEDVQKIAQSAYDRAIIDGNPQGYQRYEDILAQDAKKVEVPVGITTFTDKRLNTQVTNMFNDLNVDLGSGKNTQAANGLEWASGKHTNDPLTNDDFSKLKGKAQFAGIGRDTDGQYKMWFKVGDAKTSSNGKQTGQDELVKMNAYSGSVDAMIREGLETPARQILYQSIDNAVNNEAGNGSITVNKEGDKVGIRKATASEKELGYVSPTTNYILSYPLPDGKFKEVPATSVDDAVNHIIEVLSNNTKATK